MKSPGHKKKKRPLKGTQEIGTGQIIRKTKNEYLDTSVTYSSTGLVGLDVSTPAARPTSTLATTPAPDGLANTKRGKPKKVKGSQM